MRWSLIAVSVLALAAPAQAQDVTPAGFTLPPLQAITPQTPAKELFGRASAPADMPSAPVGFYAKGCLAGGVALPINGPNWQVMRLSRNRNWGTPQLVGFLNRLAAKAPQAAGWPGLLVGDLSQPRGGPMITGHTSHQVGLDADIWLTPMPRRILTREERETMSATNMVADDKLDVIPGVWTPGHLAIIRAAALDPGVQRIFVNAAIKKAICRDARGDRAWLAKVRPMYGHNYHFHVRLACPAGVSGCESQPAPAGGEGCGADLAWWFSDAVLHPKPPKVPVRPKPPLVMANLPRACAAVLAK